MSTTQDVWQSRLMAPSGALHLNGRIQNSRVEPDSILPVPVHQQARDWLLRFGFLLIVVAAMPSSHATMTLIQPDPSVAATFKGNGGFSADGLGMDTEALSQINPAPVGSELKAEVPAGSSVEYAYLFATFFESGDFLTGPPDGPDSNDLMIDFDGSTVTLALVEQLSFADPSSSEASTRADVTSQVSDTVGAGGGVFGFSVSSSSPYITGVALVVIYSNPSLPESTIAVFNGYPAITEDSNPGMGAIRIHEPERMTVNFLSPPQTGESSFSAKLSLGITARPHAAPFNECSAVNILNATPVNVDVNGTRISSCAGGADDFAAITVGGVDDSDELPDNAAQFPGDGSAPRVVEDELYDISDSIADVDTQLTVDIQDGASPGLFSSGGLFLSVLQVTANALAHSEICDDALDNDGDDLVDDADPDCTAPEFDSDADGIADLQDNCPKTSNADQKDTNGDGVGDACDDSQDPALALKIVPGVFVEADQYLLINYVVKNSGQSPAVDIVINDNLGNVPACKVELLSPSFEVICTAVYKTTAADVAAAGIEIEASVNGTTATATVPFGGGISGLSLVISPRPETFSGVGELILYDYIATNSTNVALTNLAISDPLTGGVVCSGVNLYIDFSVTCTKGYITTSNDVNAGVINNTATVTSDQTGPASTNAAVALENPNS